MLLLLLLTSLSFSPRVREFRNRKTVSSAARRCTYIHTYSFCSSKIASARPCEIVRRRSPLKEKGGCCWVEPRALQAAAITRYIRRCVLYIYIYIIYTQESCSTWPMSSSYRDKRGHPGRGHAALCTGSASQGISIAVGARVQQEQYTSFGGRFSIYIYICKGSCAVLGSPRDCARERSASR